MLGHLVPPRYAHLLPAIDARPAAAHIRVTVESLAHAAGHLSTIIQQMDMMAFINHCASLMT